MVRVDLGLGLGLGLGIVLGFGSYEELNARMLEDFAEFNVAVVLEDVAIED